MKGPHISCFVKSKWNFYQNIDKISTLVKKWFYRDYSMIHAIAERVVLGHSSTYQILQCSLYIHERLLAAGYHRDICFCPLQLPGDCQKLVCSLCLKKNSKALIHCTTAHKNGWPNYFLDIWYWDQFMLKFKLRCPGNGFTFHHSSRRTFYAIIYSWTFHHAFGKMK